MIEDCIIMGDLENIYRRDIPWNRLKSSTVLVTGAYGMLASYVVYLLLYLNRYHDMGIHIIAVVRSEEKFEKRFGRFAHDPFVTVYTAPIEGPLSVDGSVDYIFHAASIANPQYYALCPVDVLKPNVLDNYQLLELARKKNTKGFLFFSSGDVYGKVERDDTIKEDSVGTLDPLDVHSCYGESKRMAETMCCAYFRQYGVPIKLLRIWHTYAPTMNIETDPRVFASFMRNLVHGENIAMQSDGSACRAFCYIADAVAAFFTILFYGANGEAYNVCNTSAFCTIREFAQSVVLVRKDLALKVITKERPAGDTYIENDRANFCPPCDQKLKRLGWRPEYTLEEGLERVYDFITRRATGDQ